MKKQTLKFAGVLCALAMMFSLSAHAAKDGFTLDIPSGQAYWNYTVGNPKNDNEQRAYVTITSMTNAAAVRARVMDSSCNTACTAEITLGGKGSYTIDYTKKVSKGDYMCLGMTSTTQLQPSKVSGIWNS